MPTTPLTHFVVYKRLRTTQILFKPSIFKRVVFPGCEYYTPCQTDSFTQEPLLGPPEQPVLLPLLTNFLSHKVGSYLVCNTNLIGLIGLPGPSGTPITITACFVCVLPLHRIKQNKLPCLLVPLYLPLSFLEVHMSSFNLLLIALKTIKQSEQCISTIKSSNCFPKLRCLMYLIIFSHLW